MSSFSIFDYLDPALVDREARSPRASTVPAVWPSEASAIRIDPWPSKIVGKCHRQSYFRMTGAAVSDQIDPIGAWRWTTGRLIEDQLVQLAKQSQPKIYVSNGVKIYVPEFYLPLELDLVVRDPDTGRAWIGECKTYYGWFAKQDIEKHGKPKLENLMQDAIYLLEVGTGAKMKQLIRKSLHDRAILDARVEEMAARGLKYEHRNRCEADLEMLDQIDDGPIGAKLVYVSRDECQRTEFNVSIEEDYDGSHYPVVNGTAWKIFTVESIYERYRILQEYWFRARREAVARLHNKGVDPPPGLQMILARGDIREDIATSIKTPEQLKAEQDYLEAVSAEVVRLPDEYLPPAEYEWAYTPEKIEILNSKSLIGKTKYKDWKAQKAGKTRIGDWQCLLPGTPIELTEGTAIDIETCIEGFKTRLGPVEKVISKPVDREVVTVHPFNLLPLSLTFDHEVKTATGRYIQAAELLPLNAEKLHSFYRLAEGDELVVPFDTRQSSVGLSQDELAGIGLWLAEGHYRREDENQSGKYFGVGFTIHPKEEEIAEAIHAFAHLFNHCYTGTAATVTDRVKEDPRSGHRYRVLSINSVEAARFVQQYTQGADSHSKALTPALRQADLIEQRHLLHWMKAGDGCTTAMRGSEMHVYTSVSRQLAFDVQRLLWRQSQIAGIIQQTESGFGEGGQAYHVRWYNNDSYSSRIYNGTFFTKIRKIDRNVPYNGLVYDLSIGGSHAIPTASGVVHNCLYCGYKKICVPKVNPNWAYQLAEQPAAEEGVE